MFRDDPTILGWSLANEPRCEGDYSGSSLQVSCCSDACGISCLLDPAMHIRIDCTLGCVLMVHGLHGLPGHGSTCKRRHTHAVACEGLG